MKKVKPDEIGSALLALSGTSSQLDEEDRQRGTVLNQQSMLKQAEQEAAVAQAEEDAELAAVAARDSARQMLTDAQAKWQLYTARQYLNSLEQDRLAASTLSERVDVHEAAKADTARAVAELERLRNVGDLSEQERRARAQFNTEDQSLQRFTAERSSLDTRKGLLTSERNQLIPQASRWNGQPVTQAEDELREAADARSDAASTAGSAAD